MVGFLCFWGPRAWRSAVMCRLWRPWAWVRLFSGSSFTRDQCTSLKIQTIIRKVTLWFKRFSSLYVLYIFSIKYVPQTQFFFPQRKVSCFSCIIIVITSFFTMKHTSKYLFSFKQKVTCTLTVHDYDKSQQTPID